MIVFYFVVMLSGCGFLGLRSWVWDPGSGFLGLGFWVPGSGVPGLGSWVWGLGSRIVWNTLSRQSNKIRALVNPCADHIAERSNMVRTVWNAGQLLVRYYQIWSPMSSDHSLSNVILMVVLTGRHAVLDFGYHKNKWKKLFLRFEQFY